MRSRHGPPPPWLRHLQRVAVELRHTRFPRTAEEGLLQMARLSASGRRALRDEVAARLRGAPEGAIDGAVRRLEARLARARAAWAVRWPKERARWLRPR
jgi:hypothetical protein